jgi:hypothetical protein
VSRPRLGLLRGILAIAAVGSVWAPGARAQQVAYAASVGGELDSASQAAITREIDRARERGLPVAALMSKVREGRLKRASGMRIRGAVAALAARLESARGALGAQASPEELTAGADALAAGAGPAALRAVSAAIPTRSAAAPLGSLAQLVASGVAPRRAVEMIVSLLRRNTPPAAVLAFGNSVETDVRSGVPAEESALFRLRGVEAASVAGDAFQTASPPSLSPGSSTTPTQSKPARRRP